MILRLFLSALLCLPVLGISTPLLPGQVVVVYNSNDPQSKDLAEFYALNRRIPANQVVGIPTTEKATIDRDTFEKTIRQPLVAKFTSEKWWIIGKDANGITLPVQARIRCIALMKGMPLRISRSPLPEGETEETRQFNINNEAALDSELSLMGVASYPIGSYIPNPYFNKDLSESQNPAKFYMMVGRLDAKSYQQCKVMVLDSLDVEKDGLWGRTYLDFSKKGGGFAIGDKWLDEIAKASIAAGHPTITDRMTNTLVTNYPMNDAAIYFGWYAFHRNGPFLNDSFKFKKGAVAVHLHSMSAQQLIDPTKNWSAALLDRGAAATLGNTWEPYLQLSHHFNIFYDRLTKGYSLIEAGYMSMNVLSWQNIVIGDPLYRPFKNTSVAKETMKVDRDFKLIRYAQTKFPDAEKRTTELLRVADKTKNGTVYEMNGFRSLELANYEEAAKAFARAQQLFTEPSDQLRQSLNLVELLRRQSNTSDAIKILRQAKTEFKKLPEAIAIDGLLTILDPPAPPATKRNK
jgi:uncharacterized protein (TIGR03790 family)